MPGGWVLMALQFAKGRNHFDQGIPGNHKESRACMTNDQVNGLMGSATLESLVLTTTYRAFQRRFSHQLFVGSRWMMGKRECEDVRGILLLTSDQKLIC